MNQEIIRSVEKSMLKDKPIDFQAGDTVRVKVLIREGAKERNQNFEGMVIAIKGGGINKTFTVRRVFQGVAIERTFLVNSPKVIEVKIMRKGKAKRAKLYYMRERVGTKNTRLREDTTRIAKDFQQRLIDKEEAQATTGESESIEPEAEAAAA